MNQLFLQTDLKYDHLKKYYGLEQVIRFENRESNKTTFGFL